LRDLTGRASEVDDDCDWRTKPAAAMPPTMHAFDFILVLFSFVFVCRDLIASRRRQHIVFGPTETEADCSPWWTGSGSSSGWRACASGEAFSCSPFAEGSRRWR